MIDPYLLESLGLNFAIDYVNLRRLVKGTDGVTWGFDEYSLAHSFGLNWHIVKTPGAPVHLHNGDLVAYTTFRNNMQWVRFAERPSITTASTPPTAKINCIDLERRIYHNGEYCYVVGTGITRDELAKYADGSNLIMLPTTPTVRTNAKMYGKDVWFDLTKQQFYVYRYEQFIWLDTNTILQGALYGQYRNANQKIHSNPTQITSGSTGTNTTQAAAQQAAYYQAYLANQAPHPGLTAIQCFQQYHYGIESKPPLLREVPKVGEIIAWRGWRIDIETLTLTSIYIREKWLPAIEKVGDIPEDHASAHTGIHAFKTRKAAVKYLTTSYSRFLIALGRVALWGEVVEGETGYRAERARVLDIYCLLNYENNYKSLEKRKELRKYILGVFDYTINLNKAKVKFLKALQDKYNQPLEGGNMNLDDIGM